MADERNNVPRVRQTARKSTGPHDTNRVISLIEDVRRKLNDLSDIFDEEIDALKANVIEACLRIDILSRRIDRIAQALNITEDDNSPPQAGRSPSSPPPSPANMSPSSSDMQVNGDL